MLQVFLCTDLWKDGKILHAAYYDSKGVTEEFIKNGMTHALHVLGVKGHADPCAWTYDVVINSDDRRVRSSNNTNMHSVTFMHFLETLRCNNPIKRQVSSSSASLCLRDFSIGSQVSWHAAHMNAQHWICC